VSTQVQCQLFVTGRMYCDFVVFTNNDIVIERLYPETDFWMENVEKSKLLFKRAILPELVGRFFSRPPPAPLLSPSEQDSRQESEDGDMEVECGKSTVYCYCQGPDEGEMVACDNPRCIYQWFHLECLYLDTPPTSRTWYCPDCRKLRTRKGKGTK